MLKHTAEKMKKAMNLKNKKLFFRFFFSFMILGVIPVVILGLTSYGRILSIMKENVISSNIAFMDQGKENMDQYIGRIQNLQGQLSNNSLITGFLLKEDTDRVDKLYRIKAIREELIKYDLSADQLTDILAVYFLKNRVTITSTSFYEGDEFFSSIRRYHGMNTAASYNRLQVSNPRQYWEADTVYDEYNIPREVITSVQSLPIYSKNSHAYLITLIKADKVWEMFGDSNSDGWSNSLGIIDAHGKVIASSPSGSEIDISRLIQDMNPAQGSGYLETAKGQEKYIITYTTSPINQWTYFNVIPEENILERVAPVRRLFVKATLMAMLLAFLVSFILSRQNSRPIREIVQLIESNMDKTSREKLNDYKMIRKTVSDMFEATREMQSKMITHMEIAKMHFLQTLFRGMIDMKKINESLALYDIRLPYPSFVAAVLEVDVYEERNRDAGQNYQNYVRFAATSMIEKSFPIQFQIYAAELNENRIGLLINANFLQNENNQRIMESTFREIIEIFDDKLKVHTRIGIGTQYPSVEKVSQSYNEAISALEYISIRSSYQIMYFDQVQTCNNSLYYPLEKEQQLFNFIKLADQASAEALLDEIYRINFVERKIPVKVAWCLLNNLMSSLLKILEELKLDYQRYFDGMTSFMTDMSGTGNADEVFRFIRETLGHLCAQILEKKNNHNHELRDNVIRYVESTYSDRNLSLVMAADHFHVTAPYLSRFFKEQTGYNFNDYVNRYRVQKAKTLIEESSLSIAEISEKVGYNSSGTFIRIYKKYESITPGQYKDSCNPEQSVGGRGL